MTLKAAGGRDLKGSYTIVVHATDSAPSPFQLSTSYTLVVSMIDIQTAGSSFHWEGKKLVEKDLCIFCNDCFYKKVRICPYLLSTWRSIFSNT